MMPILRRDRKVRVLRSIRNIRGFRATTIDYNLQLYNVQAYMATLYSFCTDCKCCVLSKSPLPHCIQCYDYAGNPSCNKNIKINT